MTDRSDMLERFEEHSSIHAALRLSDKNVIVFCKARDVDNYMLDLLDDYYDMVISCHRKHVMIYDNDRVILFKSKYEDGRGYDRDNFVMVDYL
jgi:hypothetical protein